MKIFLSIGAGPGIGFATAERFAREGFRIILSARNEARTQELAQRLTALGYEAEAHAVDAGDAANVVALIAGIEARYGAVDVLHYNAASLREATLAAQPVDTFNSDLAVNIGGAMAAAQAVFTEMSKRRSGSILLTGGSLGINPSPDHLSLSIGKAGIRALSLGLFEACKVQGLHVATVTVDAYYVQPDSKEAIDIAEEFWKLHSQPKDTWTVETIYSA